MFLKLNNDEIDSWSDSFSGPKKWIRMIQSLPSGMPKETRLFKSTGMGCAPTASSGWEEACKFFEKTFNRSLSVFCIVHRMHNTKCDSDLSSLSVSSSSAKNWKTMTGNLIFSNWCSCQDLCKSSKTEVPFHLSIVVGRVWSQKSEKLVGNFESSIELRGGFSFGWFDQILTRSSIRKKLDSLSSSFNFFR